MRRYFLFCSTSLLFFTPSIKAEEVITVAWRAKPPHQYIENGVEKGILLERAKQVFTLANIPHRFAEEPAKRIWSHFTDGSKNYCSFGWYKIQERESKVRYSGIFHTDPPHTLLVNPVVVEQVTSHHTLNSLLNDTSLTLGVVDAVSYGPVLDAMIKNSKNKIERSTASPMIMARMVGANRASFMFIDREDWEFLKDKEEGLKMIRQIDLQGMPPGLNRYIICSKDVSTRQMQKINTALQKIYPAKK